MLPCLRQNGTYHKPFGRFALAELKTTNKKKIKYRCENYMSSTA
jgi:hypothetical protein